MGMVFWYEDEALTQYFQGLLFGKTNDWDSIPALKLVPLSGIQSSCNGSNSKELSFCFCAQQKPTYADLLAFDWNRWQ